MTKQLFDVVLIVGKSSMSVKIESPMSVTSVGKGGGGEVLLSGPLKKKILMTKQNSYHSVYRHVRYPCLENVYDCQMVC